MTGEILLAIACALIVGFILGRLLRYRDIRAHRGDAVSRSREVLKGQISEKMAPLLPNFPYNASDMTFIGKWVDYIVFSGIDKDIVSEVVFLEIKTGQSRQNEREKAIERAIKAGKVRYEIWRI